MQLKAVVFKAFIITAPIALLACSLKALATDSVRNGYFSIPAAPARQGWPYTAPAQLFQPSTTSDTTNPINFLNPASVAGAGLNPSTVGLPFFNASVNPTVGGASTYSGYGGGYGSGYESGYGGSYSNLSGSYLGLPFLGAVTSHIPYVGSYVPSIGLPFLGGGLTHGWGGIGHGLGGWGGFGGYLPGISSIGSFGRSGFGYGGLGYGGFGYGGSGYGGLGYGGFGYGGIGNPASYMGSAHQGTVPNKIIQTGPSPSSGNYYQPATADSSASGGYYASTAPTHAVQSAPATKHQPKSYYGSSDSDMWGSGGNPFPKDLNSVPWAK